MSLDGPAPDWETVNARNYQKTEAETVAKAETIPISPNNRRKLTAKKITPSKKKAAAKKRATA